jgi:type I restriction enzyme S subunit
VGSSKRVLKSQWKSEGVPFYRGREVSRLALDGFVDNELFISESDFALLASKYGLPRPGDILMTAIGTIGNSYIVGKEDRFYFKDASVLWLKKVGPVVSEFANYWFKSPQFFDQLDKGNGATVDTLTITKLQSVSINIPPLAEQQRIVGILDEAFEGIATAKANAEKNLQNARAIFESCLSAAITGQLSKDWRRLHPATEGACVNLKNELARLRKSSTDVATGKERNCPVTNKPIGLPDGWVLASPEQISTHIVDCPHSTPKWTKTGVLCLRTTNFKPGFLDLESPQFVSAETYSERIMRLEPKPGDVLYSREGGILGIACIIPEGVKTCLGQRMMQFRLNPNLALPEYFCGVLNSSLILSEVKRLTGGAASPHLNIRDIRTFPVPLPPIAEQRHIVGKLETVSGETQRLATIYGRKLAALDDLKKSLLHQAFSGQL